MVTRILATIIISLVLITNSIAGYKPGKKHLESLMSANKQGYESYLMFLIQIEKCKSFSIASDIDPEYSKVFKDALKKNVKVLC